jgi:hypothetical protein
MEDIVRFIVCAFLCSWLSACQGFEAITVRYEVIVTLDVEGEIATGSAVWGANVYDGPTLSYPRGPSWHVTAQAIPIVLASGDTIYALPRKASPPTDFRGATSRDYGAFLQWCVDLDASDANYVSWLAKFNGSCRSYETPVLVRFGDPRVASSIEFIQYNSHAAIIGAETSLISVEIATTDAPRTDNILQFLPWLSGMSDYDNIRTGTPDDGGMTKGGAFVAREIYALDFRKVSIDHRVAESLAGVNWLRHPVLPIAPSASASLCQPQTHDCFSGKLQFTQRPQWGRTRRTAKRPIASVHRPWDKSTKPPFSPMIFS